MIEWIQSNDALLWWLAAVSVVTFVASLVLLPWVVSRIPEDYFAHDSRPASVLAQRHPLTRWTLRLLKNVLGVILTVAGLAMLVLPGQGLLTLVVGLMLLDVPGKYRLECWLVSRPRISKAINWLRRRRGKPPIRHHQGRSSVHSAMRAGTTKQH
ncbi:MAG: hypothetical protein Kow00105_05760 [Phycisphaeraceae bacterium]